MKAKRSNVASVLRASLLVQIVVGAYLLLRLPNDDHREETVLADNDYEQHRPLTALVAASSMRQSTPTFHVMQISKPHTGSTLLNTILQGLLEDSPNEAMYSFIPKFLPNPQKGTFNIATWPPNVTRESLQNVYAPMLAHNGKLLPTREHLGITKVTKTHLIDVPKLTNAFGAGGMFDHLIFVAANREEKGLSIGKEYCQYPEVVCVDYKDFTYTNEQGLWASIARIRALLQEKLPFLSQESGNLNSDQVAFERVKRMEAKMAEMAHLDFKQSHDVEFGLHGGHQNRKDQKKYQEQKQ